MQVKQGDNVSVHYVGTLEDGTEFDNSYTRNQPLQFTADSGQMIPGFDKAILGMSVGEKKSVTIPHLEAYGPSNPDLVGNIPKTNFPPDFEFLVGEMIQGTGQTGEPIRAKIVEELENDVVIDLNHPLAGQDLNFEIELVSLG